MKEELQLIDRQINLMLSIDLGQTAGRQDLATRLNAIRGEYAVALAKRDAKDADEATRKYYAGVCDSIAKGLPNITKGSLAAAAAFKKGDYVSGTAAIMDICAAAAPMIGSMLTAGGPPGALLGALFSIVGQILSFFAPQQPSLKDQIKDMLLGLEAEEQLRTMRAVGDSIDDYAAKLLVASTRLPAILQLPLEDDANATEFQVQCKALNIGLARGQAKMDTPAFHNWTVMEWLRQEDRQDLDKWPEVLGVFCQAYTKLVNANVMFDCLADPNRVYALLDQTRETNANSPLPPGARHEVHQLLIELQAQSRAYADDWKAYNRQVRALMKDIEEPARYRGLYLHVGNGFLYGGSGEDSIVDRNGWRYLSADPDRTTSGFGHISKVTTTLAWGNSGSPKSPYHCFLLRPKGSRHNPDDAIEYRTLRATMPPASLSPTRGTFANGSGGGQSIKKSFAPGFNPLVRDIWAIPGGWDDKPNEVWLYLATGTQIIALELNEQSVLENRGWQSRHAKSQVLSVRSVYPKSVRDDPDGSISSVFDSVQPRLNTLTHYGGLENSPDVLVILPDGRNEYVQSPWDNYAGIGVDDRFLWVFGTGGFACATHTSVIKAANERATGKNESKPRWIKHYPNKVLYEGLATGDGLVGHRRGDQGPLKGLSDLAPCDDGTLMASMWTRRYDAKGNHEGDDGPHMYTADYEVDVKAQTMRVGKWTKLTGDAQQVLKQPIYCWPLFESLQANLVAEG